MLSEILRITGNLNNSGEPREIQINLRVPIIPMIQFPGYMREVLPKNPQERCFVHISGTSGAGKTTCTQTLVGALGQEFDITHFDMDWYLAGDLKWRISHESPDPKQPYLCGINPACFNLPEVAEALKKLRRGGDIEIPVYNRMQHHREGYTAYKPGRIIAVEGIHALDEGIVSEGSIRCLVVADLHSRLMRKLIRTLRVNQRGSFDEIVAEYLERMEPAYQHYVEGLVAHTDILVNNSGMGNFDSDIITSKEEVPIDNVIVPRKSYGSLGQEESVGLVRDHQGATHFLYHHKGKLLLNECVSDPVLSSLMEYYEFRAEEARR